MMMMMMIFNYIETINTNTNTNDTLVHNDAEKKYFYSNTVLECSFEVFEYLHFRELYVFAPPYFKGNILLFAPLNVSAAQRSLSTYKPGYNWTTSHLNVNFFGQCIK